jgi:hypothetical protein
MNRNKAKLLTTAGFLCCLFALILLIYNASEIRDFYALPLLLLVGGIVLMVLSLAYYTEK